MEQELAHVFAATLSADAAARGEAEAHLAALHATPACGHALSSLLLSDSYPLHLRQAAALSLRKWINERWSPYHQTFVGLPPSDAPLEAAAKPPVRAQLLQALTLPERALRLAAAYALSSASAPDWPDDFPELLPSVRQLLEQGSPDATHGAMCFLADFIGGELDETQIMGASRELLPSLERVLADTARYPPAVRARALTVFRHMLETLFMVRESYPEAAKQATAETLPQWLDALQRIVSQPLQSNEAFWEDLGLRSEAWKTLKMANHFKTHFKAHIGTLIHAALSDLTALREPFGALYTAPTEDGPDIPDAPDGDRDVWTTVPRLASTVLDFISTVLRSPQAREALTGRAAAGGDSAPLMSLLDSLRIFARMTRDDEEEWMADAGAFVDAADDDEGVGFTLRGVAADVLNDVLEMFSEPVLSGLGSVAARASSDAAALRTAGSRDAWKEEEAALALFGGVSEGVQEQLAMQTSATFDLGGVFAQLVAPHMASNSEPFLLGRCFVFASQYAAALPPQLAHQMLTSAVLAIEDESHSGSEGDVVIKLSAVRCIKNFYRHIDAAQVPATAARIIARLGPLLAVASASTLMLIVETLQLVANESQAAGPDTVPAGVFAEIIAATLQAWSREPNNHMLLMVVDDLLEALAGSKSAAHAAAVAHRGLSTLVEVLSREDVDDTLASGAVDLVAALLRGASAETLAAVDATSLTMPALVALVMKSDDRSMLQSGVASLTSLVRKVPEQTLQWTATDGTPAISCLLAIIGRLLDPADELESGGFAVGDLLIALLRKGPHAIQSVLPDLLRALINRLATVKTSTFAQSLILPFAYLMLEQASVVIELLEGLQVALPASEGAQSASGLEVLARKWVESAETIQGFWAERVSTVALSHLLEAARPSLDNVMVQGDMLPDDVNVIRTRSRAKTIPHRYTSIPLPAKILKLLVNSWQNARRGPPGPSADELPDGARTPDTDDEDGEWDDEEGQDGPKDGGDFLSDLLGPGGMGMGGLTDGLDDLATAEDADLANDEVYNMDEKAFLTRVLKAQSQRPDAASRLAPYLSAPEQDILRSALAA